MSRVQLNEENGCADVQNFPVSTLLDGLRDEDKNRLKMLLAFDDEVARVFFSHEIAIVEGDSEIIAIRNTLNCLPSDIRRQVVAKFAIIRARGKGSLLALLRYLKSLGLQPMVMHDLDTGTDGAVVFNQPIRDALADDARLIQLDTCLENVLGYDPPARDKPFRTHMNTRGWLQPSDVPAEGAVAISK